MRRRWMLMVLRKDNRRLCSPYNRFRALRKLFHGTGVAEAFPVWSRNLGKCHDLYGARAPVPVASTGNLALDAHLVLGLVCEEVEEPRNLYANILSFHFEMAECVDTTALSSQLWAELPLELIREIVLILAQSNIEKARELRLVSSDVNVLVLPILFRHVVMVLPEHVNRFTATLLPKRKNYIPALKSKLHIMPRMLSSYKVDTWVLVVNDRRPSIETALASVAPVFVGLSKLAITGQNLSSNAFWLRHHPIHPTVMLLVHYGSPHLVNFYDPIFKSVTHLYTSITHGHRYSSIADLPSLTHLAVSTRPELPETTARNVASSLKAILKVCDNLLSLVLVMDFLTLDDSLYQLWTGWLAGCLEDQRFIFLPDYRVPRMEWSDIVNGRRSLWDRAADWKQLNGISGPLLRISLLQQFMELADKERFSFPLLGDRREEEWEIDLVQRDDYNPQADDPDLRGGTGFISAFG